MRLNHLNLTVTDVPAASAFLQKYFGLDQRGGNAGIAFLTDDTGFVLTLMKGDRQGVTYPGNFHIGFSLPSEQEVDDMHARMRADGLDAPAPERHHAYGFYVTAPGGFTVEVGA